MESNVQSLTTSLEENNAIGLKEVHIPKLSERLTEELIFAFVGPVASGCTKSSEILIDILKTNYNYTVNYHKLSSYIETDKLEKETDIDKRIELLQTAGDNLRKRYGNNYLAAKAIEQIAKKRHVDGFGKSESGQDIPLSLRHVHIIDSLKHPEELQLLRDTYGDIFWTIGIFSPIEIREKRLQEHNGLEPQKIREIIQRDYKEELRHGQKVSDVFHQSDLFIRNDQENEIRLRKYLERFIEVLFGVPVHTPTIDESAMYAAYAEAAKSACLSRSVGAAITNKDGELIGLGRNDVPSSKGGLYKEDHDEEDHRCYLWKDKRCHNDKKKESLYKQIFSNLKSAELLADGVTYASVVKEIMNTDVKSLIEYSRAVHAEMDAITSIARTGKLGIIGSTLYSTTFPCHSCARHIVASGISKVFYIEPYPKSLALELHSDSISENENIGDGKVLFLQYSGIAPKNILKLFNRKSSLKDETGKLKPFNKKDASPVIIVSLDDFPTHEQLVIAELEENEKKGNENVQPALPGI